MPAKIPLLLLKIRTYASRIFNTKTRILAQAPELLQPIDLLDHSNGSTAGYTKDKILLQLSKIQSSCVRISDAKSRLIRQGLGIS
jgi:hypothetical protein